MLTSVPVLSAIISSSLNTLMWKSSEPTSNCENQRSNDCKIIKCNLNPAQKLFPIKIKRRLVNLGDLDRVLTFFRATIQTIWHFDIANKIPPSIHGCLNHSLPKSNIASCHLWMQPMRHKNTITIFAAAFTCLPINQKEQLHFYTVYYAIRFWCYIHTFFRIFKLIR